MIFHLSSNLIFTGFAASGGQGRSENAASELLSLAHKSLLPWGLFSQSKSPGHGWLMSWILHVVSEGRGTEHILGHLWHLLLLAKWGEQPKCEGYVPWLWVRPECEKNLWSKTRSRLGVVGSVRCHRVHFTMLSFFNKDSMAPHSVSEPTLVPLLYTAPNPCQGNSRSCKSKTSWTINQFFWRSISFRRKAKKVERHCQRNWLHFLATFPYAYWKNAFKTGYTSCLSPMHMLAYVYVYAHRHRCKQVVGI